MADVHLKNVRKTYGKVEVIKGVDIEIDHGEFVVFVGPSGCGKSTLLRMIAGLEDITAGDLFIDGKRVNDAEPKQRGIAMVFQSYAIFPHMSVRENVAFGLTIEGMAKPEKQARVAEAARILQMEHLLDRRPSELSGGQRQRVAIGRSIVRKPKVFLFDEPLSNLDAALRLNMRMEIGKLHQDLGATMVYVTHDQVEAMTLADKIVVLKDGYVQQIGTPMDLYHKPANKFVAGFIGSPGMNFIDVAIEGRDADKTLVATAGLDTIGVPGQIEGKRAQIGIRPQYLKPAGPDRAGMLHGTVSLTERLGTETVLDVRLANGEKIIVSLAEDRVFTPGEMIGLDFDPAQVHLFPLD